MKARLHELALAARGSCNLFQEHVCTIFCREGAEGKDLILVTPHDPRTPEYTPGVAERQRRLLMSSFRKQNAHSASTSSSSSPSVRRERGGGSGHDVVDGGHATAAFSKCAHGPARVLYTTRPKQS